jgi:hypothetical protein
MASSLSFITIQNLPQHLEHNYGEIFCMAIIQNGGQLSFIQFYETEKQRENSLKWHKRNYKMADVVFLKFNIPLKFYIENAEKII